MFLCGALQSSLGMLRMMNHDPGNHCCLCKVTTFVILIPLSETTDA
jgi:hypothetical protein